MAIPIINMWKDYFTVSRDEGLGSSYERIILNIILLKLCERLGIRTVLECPSFGFTGISGINSLGLAKKGRSVTIVDHNPERIELIKKIWHEADESAEFIYSDDYVELPFNDKQFDLSWNFAALWYVKDLNTFLSELSRISGKAVFLGVPNPSGLGFNLLKFFGKKHLQNGIHQEYMQPSNFIPIMEYLGWKLTEQDYFDIPPWPDIAMPKEKLLAKVGLSGFLNKQNEEKSPLNIMDYYKGEKPEFEQDMLKYSWLENRASGPVKWLWAHHRYFIFERVN
ncbi:MAG: methyltransferase domain-containing protein [Calditrichia bacterium]